MIKIGQLWRWLCHALLAVLLLVMGFAAHAQEDEPEGGILGTGILGTITALGSIIVNDQTIEIEPDMPVIGFPGGRRASALKPGQTVAVVVERVDARWVAQSIRQVLPLVGPVDAVTQTADGARLTVLGSDVELTGTTGSVAPGDWVAVHGLWKGQTVMSRMVERLETAPAMAEVTGSYLGGEAAQIGGTDLMVSLENAAAGDPLRVVGRPMNGGIMPERIELGMFPAPVGVVRAEGYLGLAPLRGLYTILGSGLIAFTDNPSMIDETVRVQVCGTGRALGDMSGDRATLSALGCLQ